MRLCVPWMRRRAWRLVGNLEDGVSAKAVPEDGHLTAMSLCLVLMLITFQMLAKTD